MYRYKYHIQYKVNKMYNEEAKYVLYYNGITHDPRNFIVPSTIWLVPGTYIRDLPDENDE